MIPPKILVVDDAEHIHSLIRVHFADEVVELFSAYNGKSAIESAERLQPDLILLDVDLPDIDGFEVCRRLRENPFTMHTPVIFLTATTESCKMVYGLEMGATDYITKPFDPEVLVARVHVSLRTKSRLDLLSNRRVTQFISEASASMGRQRQSSRTA